MDASKLAVTSRCIKTNLNWGKISAQVPPAKRAQLKLRRGSKWNFRFHRGAAPWCAVKLKRPIQLAHALAHIDQAQPSGFSASIGIKTNAIIGHHEANASVGAVSRTPTCLAWACFATLPSASWAMR